MLLKVVSLDEFQSNHMQYLTWFTACNSVNTVFDECSHCDLCLAGIQNDRLFYDIDFRIIMQLPRNQQSPAARLSKVEMSLLRRIDDNTIRTVHLHISRSNFLTRNGIFELTATDGNYTVFHAHSVPIRK